MSAYCPTCDGYEPITEAAVPNYAVGNLNTNPYKRAFIVMACGHRLKTNAHLVATRALERLFAEKGWPW